MKSISIESSTPVIYVHTQNAKLVIENNVKRKLKITTESPKMMVNKKAPSFKLDWNKARSQSGLRSLSYLKEFLSQKNKQKIYDAISNIVDCGNYLGNVMDYIDTETNPIAELAGQQMTQREAAPVLNVSSVPKELPDVNWDPGYMKIEWTSGEVQIEWEDDYKPDIKVIPHSVEIRVRGRKKLKITVNEDKLPLQSGKKINEKV